MAPRHGRSTMAKGLAAAIASDVCILLPSRTSLSRSRRPHAVGCRTALRPHRSSTHRAIREVLLALAAIADPTDELATVAALRSFVYGCGDDDLAHWRLGVRAVSPCEHRSPRSMSPTRLPSACSISSSSTRPVSGRPRPNFSIDSYASEACSRPRSPAATLAMCGGGCAS